LGESGHGEPDRIDGGEGNESPPLESRDLAGLPVRQGPRLLGFVAAATGVFRRRRRQREVAGGRWQAVTTFFLGFFEKVPLQFLKIGNIPLQFV